jgi:hypothetical protein
MTKRISRVAFAWFLAFVFGASWLAPAGMATADPGRPTGKLLGKFNMIGHPKNADVLENDSSNGRAVMIPLKNANGRGYEESVACEGDSTVFEDTEPEFTEVEPTGAKIHFLAGDTFDILDRDATDGNGATIQLPTVDVDGEPVLTAGVWLAAKGKPSQCIDIDAFAQDLDQNLYFFAGSVDLTRNTGKPKFVKANDLFDVHYCEVDTADDLDGDGQILNDCLDGTIEELSVFNDIFEDYFWNILNDGTRIVEVRLYPMK